MAGTELEVIGLNHTEIEKRAAEMGLPVYQYQRLAAQRAMRLTTELNFQYDVPPMAVVGGIPAKIIKMIPSREEAEE